MMTVTFSGTATSQRMYFAFNRLRVGTLNPTKRCFSTSNSILTNQVIENGANNNRIIETEKIFVKDDTTISKTELDQFRKMSTQWWTSNGEYAALRSLNKLRVPFIKQLLTGYEMDSLYPLAGFKMLDAGCGGGILAEPLSRLGGDVLGVDPLAENIEVALHHASKDPSLHSLSYKCTTVEDLCLDHSNCFDLVVASEVLEHVERPDVFIRSCCHLVKPGGHIFFTTINRTWMSTLLVKYAAEYLLKIVPENTHDKNKFVTPDELTDMLRRSDMSELKFRGMFMNPTTLRWSWTSFNSMNYACSAKKPNY